MVDTRNARFAPSEETLISGLAFIAIVLHLILKRAMHLPGRPPDFPLFAALVVGGTPMIWELLRNLWSGKLGSDLLAGISMITAILMKEYLVATIVAIRRQSTRIFRHGPCLLGARCLGAPHALHSAS